jgi:hypothetical protein
MTKPLDLDLDLFARQARTKATTLQSSRQRRMIDVYIEHTVAEIGGEIDRLMATMCPDPRFHVWSDGKDIGPKGWDGIRDMYLHMFATRSNFFQIDIQRLVIDDECMVKEYVQTTLLPGTNFMEGPRSDMLRAQGELPDPSAHYLTQGRVVILIPFDAECQMIGEDGYTSGRSTVRKVADAELPSAYRARLLT